MQRMKSQDLRARANRRQLRTRGRTNEDQHRSGRWLFERLEQAVGALLAEVISVIDDRHLALSEKRLERNSVTQAILIAMLLISDEKFERQRRFIGWATDNVQIGMASCGV